MRTRRSSPVRAVLLLLLAACAALGFDEPGYAPGGECPGAPGTQLLTFESGGARRTYLLHRPEAFRCDGTGAMLVDLHGTATVDPETSDEIPPLLALSEREGLLLVRPRSLGGDRAGSRAYQWDLNPGELALNTAFVVELTDRLAAEYRAERSRIYLSSFSNGTNLAAALLARGSSPFSGYALLGGGSWSAPEPEGWLGAGAPRIYAATGLRDHMLPYQRAFLASLQAHGFPPDRLWVRAPGGGHGRPTGVYEELWPWLDRGERPGAGIPTPPWRGDPSASISGTLAAVSVLPGGALAVAAADGGLFRYEAGGFTSVLREATDEPFTDLCFGPAGTGLAVGSRSLLLTNDRGSSWASAPVQDLEWAADPAAFHLTGGACARDGRLLVVGDGIAARSTDGGLSWEPLSLEGAAPGLALTSVAVGPTGTVVAVGADGYVGRSADGLALVPAVNPYDPAVAARYVRVTAASAGVFWAVGDAGRVLLSSDDGLSWADRSVGEPVDLHGIAGDALAALVVGDHGRGFFTGDGGGSWSRVPTGVDVSLLAAAFLGGGSAVAVGEASTLLWLDP